MKKSWLVIGIVILGTLFFLYGITEVSSYIFDEVHYLTAVKMLLHQKTVSNIEHPPLAKYIMAVSIQLFGDNPLGWRFFSALSGGISLGMLFLISELVFSEIFTSLTIVVLAFLNFMFFVLSRLAMIDIFMMANVLIAIFYFIKFVKAREKKFWYLAAFFTGVSLATKWSALFILFPIFLVTIPLNKKIYKDVLSFGAIAYGANFIFYLPYLFYKTAEPIFFGDLFYRLPLKMLAILNSVTGTHAYNSKWYSWPFMIRPIWFHYQVNPLDIFSTQGIIFLGNPFLMALGLISILWMAFKIAYTYFSKNIFLINETKVIFVFLFSWIIWSKTGRSFAFYYYFFPSATIYLFTIIIMLLDFIKNARSYKIALFSIISISLAFFLYFYPILSGVGFKTEMGIDKWMWFSSWI